MTNIQNLKKVVDRAIESFKSNSLLKDLEQKNIQLKQFHSILNAIAHQVYSSSATFALAGANTAPRLEKIRLYLFHHADEEKDHYRWIIDDLKSTGFTGLNPLEKMPPPACLNYIMLNYYVAQKHPYARLGIAAVLESIGAELGKASFIKIVEQLNLQPNQVSFFYGHGDTDVGHIADIFKVLEDSPLTQEEWDQICYFAERAGELYKAMYEEAAKNVSS